MTAAGGSFRIGKAGGIATGKSCGWIRRGPALSEIVADGAGDALISRIAVAGSPVGGVSSGIRVASDV